jgi:hyaluronoglucosaminidase
VTRGADDRPSWDPGSPRLGLIEGFYGTPWSHAARLTLIRELGALGLSTYLHAPKNELRGLADLRSGAPLVAELGELAALGREQGVAFVHGLSPYKLLDPDDVPLLRKDGERARRLVARRARALREAGVERFAVLFDDTWATLIPKLATEATGRAHGDVASVVEDVAGAEVWVVPAVYFGRARELSAGARRYLVGLRASGRRPTAWTGPRIFSRFIGAADVAEFERATDLPLWIWSNAIANDWLPLATGEPLGLRGNQRLCFGPVHSVSPGVVREHPVLLNGARERLPTLVALHVLSDLARAGDLHEPARAIERAIESVCGEHAAVVQRIADAVGAHSLVFPHLNRAGPFERALGGSSGARRDVLEEHLELLAGTVVDLARAAESDPRLLELLPTAERITETAHTLRRRLGGSPREPAPRSTWSTSLERYLDPERLTRLLLRR